MNADTFAVAQHTTTPHHPRRMLTRVVLTVLAALWAPGAIQAHGGGIAGAVQAQDGVIDGTVADTTGLVLPGVTVEARSTAAGGAEHGGGRRGARRPAVRPRWP